jgi:transketolase
MQITKKEVRELEERSRKLRLEAFDLSRENNGYHYGGTLSQVEILVSLYKKIFDIDKDRFLLDKGHCAFSLYPLLKEKGYEFPDFFLGNPQFDVERGIYGSTGSLGMGLPIGTGLALAKKLQGEEGRVYTLMGETGIQEGTCWESLLIANKYKLDNLTVIIDRNNVQCTGTSEEILPLGNLEAKFEAFNAKVYSINGHSHKELCDTLPKYEKDKVTMIIANTIKGKGAKIMEEDPVKWHCGAPKKEEWKKIYSDLGEEYKEIEIAPKIKELLGFYSKR